MGESWEDRMKYKYIFNCLKVWCKDKYFNEFEV